MKDRRKQVVTMVLAMSFLFGVMVVLQGCESKCGSNKSCEINRSCDVGASKSCGIKSKQSCDIKGVEQTVCPVMGGKINKSIYTEYQGQKVYFCCGGCVGKFEKEPEKYISKLNNVSSCNK